METGSALALALVALVTLARSASSTKSPTLDPEHMRLFLMHDKAAKDGAVCLDGSPGGFYLKPATSIKHGNDWLLHFKGAGWCYDEEDCWSRSNMEFGSSTKWENVTGGWNGGILAPGDDIFGAFNKVILLYCDGASFSGDRSDAVVVKGKPLFFRGKRILDAIIETLARDHGLTHAHDVLLTGCSSGGLAAYLHADYLARRFASLSPSLRRFRVAPASGFFLLHDNIAHQPVYATQMRYIFVLSNSTGGVNAACVAAMGEADAWKCIFAQHSYAHTTVPVFVENSALDAWQTDCIYCAAAVDGFPRQSSDINGNCSAVPGWADCSADPEKCSAAQIPTMNKYISDFVAVLNATAKFHAAGSGAFIHSCHEHCEALAAPWFQFVVGGVKMNDAVRSWWNSDGTDAAALHSYLPCEYKEASPHKCNPTCPSSTVPSRVAAADGGR